VSAQLLALARRKAQCVTPLPLITELPIFGIIHTMCVHMHIIFSFSAPAPTEHPEMTAVREFTAHLGTHHRVHMVYNMSNRFGFVTGTGTEVVVFVCAHVSNMCCSAFQRATKKETLLLLGDTKRGRGVTRVKVKDVPFIHGMIPLSPPSRSYHNIDPGSMKSFSS
jgi:hypothetical protein